MSIPHPALCLATQAEACEQKLAEALQAEAPGQADRLAVSAWIGEVLKFEATIAAYRQFDCRMDDLTVALETTMPAAHEALGIGGKIQPTAQFAYLEVGFADQGRSALPLLSCFSRHLRTLFSTYSDHVP
jgi:hypothetical protein